MIFTKLFLVIVVVVAIINESDSTHHNDPYKSSIKALKALRHAEKYRLKAHKYAHRPQPQLRPDGFGSSFFESGESSEDQFRPFFMGPFQSFYPGFPPFNRPNRPGVTESSGSGSSGDDGGNNGGGNNGGSNNGGGNSGGGGQPQYPILQPGNEGGSRLPSSGGGDILNGFLGLLQGVIRFQ